MSDSYKLDDFLFSIKASIYRANKKAWIQHLNNLRRYFLIEKGTGVWKPRMLRMMLPTTEVDDNNVDVEENQLPIASLVEHNPLTMASLSVEFECYIEGLTDTAEDELASVSLVMTENKRNLPKAKFSIEYKTNEEATEGIARINDKLLKHF